jgi:hypothetical protein
MRSQPLIVAVILAFGSVSLPISASAASLAGTWRGNGYVAPKSAAREKVRCRVTYRKQSAKVFSVRAVCASKSATVRQTGTVLMVNRNRYIGDFYNSQFDVSGRVRVTLHGASQTVTFSGGSGHGRLTLRK